MADLRFVETWHLLVAALRAVLSEELHLSDPELNHLSTVFLDRIPASLPRKPVTWYELTPLVAPI